jgi:hypothetical protein
MQIPVRPFKARLIRAGIPRIDWHHPLTFGLVGCWLPGLTRGYDLTDNCSPMAYSTSGTIQSFGSEIEGSVLPGGQTTTEGNIYSVVAPSVFKGWNNFSLYYRGVLHGTAGNQFNYLLYIAFDNGNATPPYEICSIGDPNSAGALTTVSVNWNNSGGEQKGTGVDFTGNSLISCLGTLTVGGNNILYRDGLQVASNAWNTGGTGQATTSATTAIQINGWTFGGRFASPSCYMACAWNRTLSAAEAQYLDADPYGFLIWPEDEIFATWVGAAATPPVTGTPFSLRLINI